MIKFRVRRNFSFKQLADQVLPDTTIMRKVGEWVRDRIAERTARGLDQYGRAFTAYSESYRRRTGKSRVDLRVSGAMLGSIDVTQVGPTSVRIEPKDPSAQQRAVIHQTGGPIIPRRAFMGLTANQRKELMTFIRQELRRKK